MFSKLLSLSALVAAVSADGHESSSDPIMVCLQGLCAKELTACMSDNQCAAELMAAMESEDEPTPEEIAKWSKKGQTLYGCYSSSCTMPSGSGFEPSPEQQVMAIEHLQETCEAFTTQAEKAAEKAKEMAKEAKEAAEKGGMTIPDMNELGDKIQDSLDNLDAKLKEKGLDEDMQNAMDNMFGGLDGDSMDMSELGDAVKGVLGDMEGVLGDNDELTDVFGGVTDLVNNLGDNQGGVDGLFDSVDNLLCLSCAPGSCPENCKRLRSRRGAHGHSPCEELAEAISDVTKLCKKGRARRDGHEHGDHEHGDHKGGDGIAKEVCDAVDKVMKKPPKGLAETEFAKNNKEFANTLAEGGSGDGSGDESGAFSVAAQLVTFAFAATAALFL